MVNEISNFWGTIKPFLAIKGCLENSDIILIHSEEIILSDRILNKRFSVHHVNINECSSGFKPS